MEAESLKIDVEQISPVVRKLSVEVPWEVVAQELELAYEGLSKRARLKGFRAGKVPRPVLERMYKKTVESEVVGRLVDDMYRHALDARSLEPIASPELKDEPELKPNHPFRFSAEVQVRPEVEVRDYKGLTVEKQVQPVSSVEVEKELEQLRERATVIEQVTDRTVSENGDLLVVDFFGTVDGESFKGGKGINYTVELGGGQMIPGFEEALVGAEIGEEKTFKLAFPEDTGPDEVRGKTVDWKVDVKEIKRKILPDLDDEFAKDLGEYDSLAELRENIEKNLATRQDAATQQKLRQAVVDVLVEKNSVDVPPVMVDRQLDFLMQDAEQAIQQSTDPRLREALDRLREESRTRAEQQVAGMLLLEAVARAEALEVSDNDVEGRVQDMAREYRMPLADLKKRLKEGSQLEAIRYNMRQDRAVDWLLDNASIVEVEAKDAAADDSDASA